MRIKEINRKKNALLRKIRLNFIKLLVDHKKKKTIDLNKISSILFLRNDDKLGDMIVATPCFKAAYLAGCHVHVITGKNSSRLLEANPYVKNIYFYPKGFIARVKLALQLRKKNFDLLIDNGYYIRPDTLLFIRLLKPHYSIGVHKENYQLFDYSIPAISIANKHMAERNQAIFEQLTIPSDCANYDIHIPQSIDDEVISFLKQFSKKIIIINPFAASKHRNLSVFQIEIIKQHLQTLCAEEYVFIIIGSQHDLQHFSLAQTILSPFNHILYSAALIKYATLVISPDTSIVHLATAFHKSTVALYKQDNPDTELPNSVTWSPNNPKAKMIFTHTYHDDVKDIDPILIANEAIALLKDSSLQ